MSAVESVQGTEFDTFGFEWSWRDVLGACALGELVVLLITTFALRDLLAAGLAVILLVGFALLLLRGKVFGFVFEAVARVILWRIPEERLAAVILAALFADIGFYTLTGTLTNLANGAAGLAILLPASLAAFAVPGFVAAVVCVVRPGTSAQPSRGAVNLVVASVIVTCVVLGIGLLRGDASAARVLTPSTLKLAVENMSYSSSELSASAGTVSVALENHDLFWHTFTIDALGVDMRVPMQATERVSFQAEPGSYAFHCTIPGHELLGMQGTLTITP